MGTQTHVRVSLMCRESLWFDAGGRPVTIRLDNSSHSSRVRRCYAKCPWHEGENCTKHIQLNQYDAVWKCVAYVLFYMKMGSIAESKAKHWETIPDDAAINSVKDELPRELIEMPYEP